MLIFHVKILMLDHKIQHFTTQKLMVIILSLFFMAKNHIKKRKRKKTHVEKHYNNSQCFVRKTIIVILNRLNIKKKATKIILEKIVKKT